MNMPSGFVPFDITVCGLDELEGFCNVGVSHVLSILDPGFPEPAAFGAYGEHERLELRFDDVIEEARGVRPPERADVEALLAFGRDLLAAPPPSAPLPAPHLLVHCHAGVSRSTAAMTLLLAQARPDRPATEALAEVVGIRPIAWPNLRIIEFGDALLGRDGALVAAVRAHYRARLTCEPGFGRLMIEVGRGREVREAAADPGAWEAR